VSPISREQAALYPANWREIVASIRARSGGRCECDGRCGLHRGRRCSERQHEPAQYARGLVRLTVMHLDHDPRNNAPANLADACQRCHNRYDQPHRQRNAATTRRAKRGNLELPL
jgi:hypothetical protein